MGFSAMVERKIAVINVGWSEDYQGADIITKHRYVLAGGEGHERFNLLPAQDGRYYGSIPGGKHPAPADPDGWLVFMVSKQPSQPGLVVIGWFEDASFDTTWPLRPDWKMLKRKRGVEYHYSLSADRVFIVPRPAREFTFRGDHVKRPFAYLRGEEGDEPWREELAEVLLSYRARLSGGEQDAPSDAQKASGGFCVDPELRKKVDEAAIKAVKSRYKQDYTLRDRQKDTCGYDLEFTSKSGGPTLCIEVKGTSNIAPHFIISANEFNTGKHLSDKPHKKGHEWLLAMVTDALGTPKIKIYTFDEMCAAFDLAELSWHATPKPRSEKEN